MSKKVGIQINNSGDLNVSISRDNTGIGGLVVGNTLYQNQYVLLKSHYGDLKENALLGVGIDDMTNDEDILSWKKTIREEFAKDGLKTTSLTIDNTGMTLIADY